MTEVSKEEKLFAAVRDLDVDLAIELLSTPGINLNYQDADEKTAFMTLIETQPNISCERKDDPELFRHNVNKGQKRDVIASLFMQNALTDVNIQDNQGNTALILAAKGKQHKIWENIIVRPNTQIHACNATGETGWMPDMQREAIVNSVVHSKSKLFDVLVEEGTDINAFNNKGLNPLLVAAYTDNKDALAKLLNNSEVNLNHTDIAGNTALAVAVRKKNIDLMEQLLAKKELNPNIVTNTKKTPLQIAIETKNSEATYLLASDLRVDPNGTDSRGTNFLWSTLNQNNNLCARALVSCKRCNLDTLDPQTGDTPLIYAARKRNNELTESLVKYGADVNIVNKNGQNALSEAIQNSLSLTNLNCVSPILEAPGLSSQTKESGFKLIQQMAEKDGITTPVKIQEKMDQFKAQKLMELRGLSTSNTVKRPRISQSRPIFSAEKGHEKDKRFDR